MHKVMDPQQPPAKTSAKLAVHFFNNLGIASRILSCIDACFYSVGIIESTEVKPKLASTIETMKENSQIVTYHTREIGSNYYKKEKETFIGKLEKEGRGKFEHENLKTHEEFSNDLSEFSSY